MKSKINLFDKNKRIYLYIGTTAELIKLAPVIKRLKSTGVKFKIIYSGQVNINFSEFKDYPGEIIPDITLEVRKGGSSISKFILWTFKCSTFGLVKLRSEFKNFDLKKSFLIVQGDTVSSLIGAFTGKLYKMKVVHIESGLRSFNFFEPFPEEICRYLITHLSDICFCPNEWAVNNLKNIPCKKVNTKNNTLYEIYKRYEKYFRKSKRFINNKYFVLIVHRQEHVIFGKKRTKELLKIIMKNTKKDMTCVFLVHDISKDLTDSVYMGENKVIYEKRLPYKQFLSLLYHSDYVITDGGSNQEELSYMGKPTLILRRVTERIEGLNENIVLSKYDKNTITNFIKDYRSLERKPIKSSAYPSKTIVNFLTTGQ